MAVVSGDESSNEETERQSEKSKSKVKGEGNESRVSERSRSPNRHKRDKNKDDEKRHKRKARSRSRSKETRSRSRSKSPEHRRHRQRSRSPSHRYSRHHASSTKHRESRHSPRQRSRSPDRRRARCVGAGRNVFSSEPYFDHRRDRKMNQGFGQSAPRSMSDINKTASESMQHAIQEAASTLPSYMKPGAVNPLQFKMQQEKRKLLWGNKKKEEGTTATKQWAQAVFSGDDAAKYRRMMGLSDPGVADANENLKAKQQEANKKLMEDLDKQYEMSRLITHTDQFKKTGFGFTSNVAAAPTSGAPTSGDVSGEQCSQSSEKAT